MKKRIDWNEITCELQDRYVKMNGAELKKEFNKGAGSIWKEIFSTETQKILYRKMLGVPL